MKKENLVKAAVELNTLLGLEPAISTKGDEKVMSDKIVEASALLEPTDKVSVNTLAVLKELGVKVAGAKEEAKAPARGKKSEPADDEPEPEEEEKDEPEEEEKDEPEADEPEEEEEEKPKAKGAKKPEADKPKASRPNSKYSKNQAMYDALKKAPKGITKQDLAIALDALYVKNGGDSSPSGAKATVDINLSALKIFGAVEEKDGKLFLTSK